MLAENLHIDGISEGELVGRGGSGKVYRARQPHLERDVAVKVIPPGDEITKRRFLRERRAMGKLSDVQGIVPVYDAGISETGELYLIMPFLPGGSLVDIAPLPWEQACEIIETISYALQHAHDHDIVHRDIKPANILLTSGGEPLLADFGIAKLLSDTTHQTAGVMTLTPAYSAPETFDHTTGTPRGDIYSLGATLWHLIAGRAPFTEAGTTTTVGQLIGRVVGRQVGDLHPLCPDSVCTLIESAMAKAPADRPGKASDFADALRAARLADAGWTPADPTVTVDGWTSLDGASDTNETWTAPPEVTRRQPSDDQATPARSADAGVATADPAAPPVDAAHATEVSDSKRHGLIGAAIAIAGGIAAVIAGFFIFGSGADGSELEVPELELLDVTATSAHLAFDIEPCVVATWTISAVQGGGPADGGLVQSNGYPSTDIECFINNNYQPGIWSHPLRPGTTYKGDVTISDGQGNLASSAFEFTTKEEELALPELTISDITPTSARVSFQSETCVAVRWEIRTVDRGGPRDTGLITSKGYPETSQECFLEAIYEPGIETVALTPGTTYNGTLAISDGKGLSNNGTFEFTTAAVTVPEERNADG